MKQWWLIIFAGLIIAIVFGFYFFKSSNVVKDDVSSVGNNIEIRNFAFVPQELIIKVGDTVSWTNQDSAKHTVTSSNGNELDSELLVKGEIYTHTFDNIGVYDYYCTLHPSMVGKIIVE